jgi:hypothetical protein
MVKGIKRHEKAHLQPMSCVNVSVDASLTTLQRVMPFTYDFTYDFTTSEPISISAGKHFFSGEAFAIISR